MCNCYSWPFGHFSISDSVSTISPIIDEYCFASSVLIRAALNTHRRYQLLPSRSSR